MKVIGIVGGLSPESTMVYYRALNQGVRERTEYQHQAKIALVSVDGTAIALKPAPQTSNNSI
jgi:aspartate racemase